MRKNLFLPVAAIIIVAIFLNGCNNAPTAKEATIKTDSSPTVVTNPNISLAPVEYSELSEKSLQLLAKGDYDAWADMLADNVLYAYPDGDMNTRTKIKGKDSLVTWWKNSKESGLESMSLTDFNHTPINAIKALKAGAPTGIYDLVYFTNKMIIKGKPVSIRMNFSVHFNTDKKIDAYYTYYDRSQIIKAAGKNTLENLNEKK